MGVLNPLKSFLPVKWVTGLLLAFLAWQGIVFTQLRPRDYTEAEKIAIRRVCEKARVLSVVALDPTDLSPVALGVAHLLNDPSNYFTDSLKGKLAGVANFTLQQGSVAQRFLADVMEAVQEATSFEELAFAANNVELQSMVCGRVEEVNETDGIGYAVLGYHIYDIAAGEWILHERIEADSRVEKGAWLKRHWKVLAALLLIGLIPWLSFQLLEKVVERNSNAASAALIAGLVAVDLLLLWWAGLFGAKVAVPVVGVVLAVGYNLWACDFMAKKVE